MGRAVEVYRDWNGDYRWRVIGEDGRTLGISPTRYPTRASARAAAWREAERLGITDIIDDA